MRRSAFWACVVALSAGAAESRVVFDKPAQREAHAARAPVQAGAVKPSADAKAPAKTLWGKIKSLF